MMAYSASRLDRRTLLTGLVVAPAVLSFGRAQAGGAYLFPLGVASGDPEPDGFVIWTRLAADPLAADGLGGLDAAIPVRWEVAADDQFRRIAAAGNATAARDAAHSLHVEVAGLSPHRPYWYRFTAQGQQSPTGRALTTPAPNASADRLRLAVASCSHWERGYFSAYGHMADEQPDLTLFLGDYIYEYSLGPDRADQVVRPYNLEEATSLAGYRNRYALHRTDANLQRLHAVAPCIAVWDDHEVQDDYSGVWSKISGVAPNDFLQRRAAAYQAFYEAMPIRRTSLPHGPDMQLYRKLSFGNLAELFVLDGRQYRSDQPCGDGRKTQCPDALAAERSMLGAPQEKWLASGLEASPAKWNVLAQQVMMARVGFKPDGEPDTTYSMDQWPGYEANRRRILRHFHDKKIANPIVLTGDIHSNWANDLILDFDDLDSKIVASEFVGTSIASGGDGYTVHPRLGNVLAQNPFVKLVNAQRGYVSCTVTPEKWQTDYRIVEYIRKRGAPLQTLATFIVEDGRPGMQKA